MTKKKEAETVTIDLSGFEPVSVEAQREKAIAAAFKGKDLEGCVVDMKFSKAFDNAQRLAIRNQIAAAGGLIGKVN